MKMHEKRGKSRAAPLETSETTERITACSSLVIYLPIYATAARLMSGSLPACTFFSSPYLAEINTALRVNQIYANGFGIGPLCAPTREESAQF